MKVFISWSGRRSRALAEILSEWLPLVLHAVKPYFTPNDLAKGARWSAEVAKELEDSQVGLLCVTPENLSAPWMMFEAGALSKNIDKSRVCPILFGIEPANLEGPLVQFQASKFEKSEVKQIVGMMNAALPENPLDTRRLDSTFEKWWSELETKVASALSAPVVAAGTSQRSDRQLLEESLEILRSLAKGTEDPMSGRLQMETRSVSWSEYRDRVTNLTDTLSELQSQGLYEPDVIIGISNGGLAVADSILRLVYRNSIPLVCLWAQRSQEYYFNGAVNESLISKESFRRIVGDGKSASGRIRVLVVDDIVGTTRTFLQLARFLTERLGDLMEQVDLKFTFLYTPRRETLLELDRFLLSAAPEITETRGELHLEQVTLKSELPYRKSIHYGSLTG